MLPVPMLPMANGAGSEARWDLRVWKPATPMKLATPNEAPPYRHAGGRWMKRSLRFPYGMVSGSWHCAGRSRGMF